MAAFRGWQCAAAPPPPRVDLFSSAAAAAARKWTLKLRLIQNQQHQQQSACSSSDGNSLTDAPLCAIRHRRPLDSLSATPRTTLFSLIALVCCLLVCSFAVLYLEHRRRLHSTWLRPEPMPLPLRSRARSCAACRSPSRVELPTQLGSRPRRRSEFCVRVYLIRRYLGRRSETNENCLSLYLIARREKAIAMCQQISRRRRRLSGAQSRRPALASQTIVSASLLSLSCVVYFGCAQNELSIAMLVVSHLQLSVRCCDVRCRS